MLLRALLYLQIVYTVYQVHYPFDTHVPGVNVSNLLFCASLILLAGRGKTPLAAHAAQLRGPLLAYFAMTTLAFVTAQVALPHNLMDDATYLKNALFYPLLYFLYLRCGQDLATTRRMLILVLVVAVIAGAEAVRQGLDYGFAAFAENHRASGPFGSDYRDANRAGVYYATFLPMFVAITLFFRQRHLWRLCAFAAIAVLGFAVLVTYSRQSYFIVLLGLVLLLLRRSVVLAGVLGVILVAASSYLPDTVSQRIEDTHQRGAAGGEQVDESTASRWEIWSGAWSMWQEHPYGVGLNRFPDLIGGYSPYRHKDAHNFYVLTLAEAGIQGLLVLLLLVRAILALARRLRMSASPNDPEAQALALGFTVTAICMACGNLYGSPFLAGAVMGDFWILCGLLERLMVLRQAMPATIDAAPAVAALPPRFPLAAHIHPGRSA
jgi:O-antigen ligase